MFVCALLGVALAADPGPPPPLVRGQWFVENPSIHGEQLQQTAASVVQALPHSVVFTAPSFDGYRLLDGLFGESAEVSRYRDLDLVLRAGDASCVVMFGRNVLAPNTFRMSSKGACSARSERRYRTLGGMSLAVGGILSVGMAATLLTGITAIRQAEPGRRGTSQRALGTALAVLSVPVLGVGVGFTIMGAQSTRYSGRIRDSTYRP